MHVCLCVVNDVCKGMHVWVISCDRVAMLAVLQAFKLSAARHQELLKQAQLEQVGLQ